MYFVLTWLFTTTMLTMIRRSELFLWFLHCVHFSFNETTFSFLIVKWLCVLMALINGSECECVQTTATYIITTFLVECNKIIDYFTEQLHQVIKIRTRGMYSICPLPRRRAADSGLEPRNWQMLLFNFWTQMVHWPAIEKSARISGILRISKYCYESPLNRKYIQLLNKLKKKIRN